MGERPASAVSLFTAVSAGAFLILGVVAVLMRWAPPSVLVWCGALAVVAAVSLWAAKGRR